MTLTIASGSPAGRGCLALHVRGAGDRPVLHDLQAWLWRPDGQLGGIAMVTGPGRALFRDVQAGRYRLQVRSRGFQDKQQEGVAIAGGGEVADMDLELLPAIPLAGTVAGGGASGGSTLVVTARRPGERLAGERVVADARGHFRFERTGPGPWLVQAARTEKDGRTLMLSPVLTVDLPEDGPSRPLDLQLAAVSSLELHLEGAFPDVASGAMVTPVAVQRAVDALQGTRFRLVDLQGRTWMDVSAGSLRRYQQGNQLVLELLAPAGRCRLQRLGNGVTGTVLDVTLPGRAVQAWR